MTSTEPDGGTTEPLRRSQEAIDDAKDSAKDALTGLSPGDGMHEPGTGEEHEPDHPAVETPPL